MKALAFPKMFVANKTQVVSDLDNKAILQNIKLLLQSKIKETFGDPEYGVSLVPQLFNNNAAPLKSIIIDNIYTTIQRYIPEVKIRKEDITIYQDHTDLRATIKVYKNSDTSNKNNLYNIDLIIDE